MRFAPAPAPAPPAALPARPPAPDIPTPTTNQGSATRPYPHPLPQHIHGPTCSATSAARGPRHPDPHNKPGLRNTSLPTPSAPTHPRSHLQRHQRGPRPRGVYGHAAGAVQRAAQRAGDLLGGGAAGATHGHVVTQRTNGMECGRTTLAERGRWLGEPGAARCGSCVLVAGKVPGQTCTRERASSQGHPPAAAQVGFQLALQHQAAVIAPTVRRYAQLCSQRVTLRQRGW